MYGTSNGAVRAPKVSVGLPVFNGENFLSQAIESILDQDFRDFELIIADNASTDRTAEICQEYAQRDRRIRVIRHPRNIGAAKNYNYVLHCGSGEFFKWAAHDDVLGKQFLSQCLHAFETSAEETILVYPNFQFTDENLNPIDADSPFVHTTSDSAVTRFRETLAGLGLVTSVFGLYRRDALLKTRLIGSFISSDFVLLAETALLGKIVRIQKDVQFYRRLHDDMSTRSGRSRREVLTWFDPDAGPEADGPQALNWQYLRTIHSLSGLTRMERLRASRIIARRMLGDRLRPYKSRLRIVTTAPAPLQTRGRLRELKRT